MDTLMINCEMAKKVIKKDYEQESLFGAGI